jgi:hypothetical protein
MSDVAGGAVHAARNSAAIVAANPDASTKADRCSTGKA